MNAVVAPATVAIVGGGQLGRYAVMAAAAMGYHTMVLDPDPVAPAGLLAHEHIVAAYDDPAALAKIAAEADAVTTEFENPPAAALDELAASIVVAPPPAAVRIAQDRIAEKAFFVDNGFPVGPHQTLIGTDPTFEPSLVSGPAIVKTARLGYDGKGQRRVATEADARAAWIDLGRVDCVIERQLDLETELSVIVGRSASGDLVAWPVAENTHVSGILDVSIVPASVSVELATRAVELATEVAHALDYVGVLAVELFVVAGELFVNELAPRPHNSGHWTLDASVTSQYEQQVRAMCGLPLGATELTAPAIAMVNLLGDLWLGGEPDWAAALDDPNAKLHLYGKAEARPGRKMGHLTVTAATAAAAAAQALALRAATSRGQT